MNETDAIMYAAYADDPELAMAIKMSMLEEEAKKMVVPDEPAKDADPSTVVTLQLRLSDGSKLQRAFNHSDKAQVKIIYN